MPRRAIKFTFFAALVAFILWVIARVRDEIESDPFDVED